MAACATVHLAASDVDWRVERVQFGRQFFLTAGVTVCILLPTHSHGSQRSEMPSIHLLETRNKMRMDGTYVEDLKGAQVIDVHVLCAG